MGPLYWLDLYYRSGFSGEKRESEQKRVEGRERAREKVSERKRERESM